MGTGILCPYCTSENHLLKMEKSFQQDLLRTHWITRKLILVDARKKRLLFSATTRGLPLLEVGDRLRYRAVVWLCGVSYYCSRRNWPDKTSNKYANETRVCELSESFIVGYCELSGCLMGLLTRISIQSTWWVSIMKMSCIYSAFHLPFLQRIQTGK